MLKKIVGLCNHFTWWRSVALRKLPITKAEPWPTIDIYRRPWLNVRFVMTILYRLHGILVILKKKRLIKEWRNSASTCSRAITTNDVRRDSASPIRVLIRLCRTNEILTSHCRLISLNKINRYRRYICFASWYRARAGNCNISRLLIRSSDIVSSNPSVRSRITYWSLTVDFYDFSRDNHQMTLEIDVCFAGEMFM